MGVETTEIVNPPPNDELLSRGWPANYHGQPSGGVAIGYPEFSEQVQYNLHMAPPTTNGQLSGSAIGLNPQFNDHQVLQYNLHMAQSVGIAPNHPVTGLAYMAPTSTDLDPADPDAVKKAKKKESDRKYRDNVKDKVIKDLNDEIERLKLEIARLTDGENVRIALLESENNRLMGDLEKLRRKTQDPNYNTDWIPSDVEISEDEDDDDDDDKQRLDLSPQLVMRMDIESLKEESVVQKSQIQTLTQTLTERLDRIERSNHKQKNNVQNLLKKLKKMKGFFLRRKDH